MTETASAPLLRIERLRFGYGENPVLHDVDLEVRRGEIVTVVGSNGAGKSTLLKNVSGLVRPASGRVLFDGEEVSRRAPHEIVARGLVQVPEGRRLFPEMTVLDNLRMGSFTPGARPDRERNLDRVFGLFPRVKERARQLAGTLSGGEQQMVAIARGLVANPQLLMLDEPSLGLSPLLTGTVFDIIREINRQGVTVLLVEQNVRRSLRVAHRGYVIETGRIVLEGPAGDLLGNESVRKAYIGL